MFNETLMCLGYVLVSIVVAGLCIALDTPLALFRLWCISLLSVDAAGWRDLFCSRASRISCDPFVALIESQAAQ